MVASYLLRMDFFGLSSTKSPSHNGNSLAEKALNCLSRLAARRSIRCACVILLAIVCFQLLTSRVYPSFWNVLSRPADRSLPMSLATPTDVIGSLQRNATASSPPTAVNALKPPPQQPPRQLPPQQQQQQPPPQTEASTPCPEQPPDLLGDKFPVQTDPARAPSWLELETSLSDVKHGGSQPAACVARQRVAIIIPYRNRDSHLRLLLSVLHPMLRRQQLHYRIFVIEQAGTNRFNRAMLFNIGFVEVSRIFPADCYIFHDVDLLPEHDHNIYRCGDRPRHMSAAVDKFNYRLPYETIFGGVTALSAHQFRAANGFSNVFFGWGGEDDDFRNRVVWAGFQVARYPMSVARYKMIKHNRDAHNDPNPLRITLIKQGLSRWKSDGLNSMDYSVVAVQDRRVVYFISVEIPEGRVLKKFNIS